MTLYEFKIVEHCDDGPPEDFGYERLERIPCVGQTIMLHWLSGEEAYPVRVLDVTEDCLRLDVIREDQR